jgi:hypothetical protein
MNKNKSYERDMDSKIVNVINNLPKPINHMLDFDNEVIASKLYPVQNIFSD